MNNLEKTTQKICDLKHAIQFACEFKKIGG